MSTSLIILLFLLLIIGIEIIVYGLKYRLYLAYERQRETSTLTYRT